MTTLIDPTKFRDPKITSKGERRAAVAFEGFKTLWFNTGSLCNIECANCYILSSPTADHFIYLTPDDMAPFLDELTAPIEIGLTGGEPFLNPDSIRLCEMALERGHAVLILTNAMRPMMRPRVQAGLLDLNTRFPGKMTLRVSLDHFTAEGHDAERGDGFVPLRDQPLELAPREHLGGLRHGRVRSQGVRRRRRRGGSEIRLRRRAHASI